jgi:RNA polymerase subunit RPABC4/transcription elongation factor Spt4
MDESYHSEIKGEYERLHKKLEAERKKEFDRKIKELEKQELLKTENKYKSLLKGQESKFKKELELAAQRVFELEEQISRMDQQKKLTSETALEETKKRAKELETESISVKETVVEENNDLVTGELKKQGLPVKLPKEGEDTEGKSKIRYTIEKDEKEKDRKRRKKKRIVSKAQCGACGEYIPVNSTTCPFCGVTFSKPEVELGACGNCGNLIPVSVKECPICEAKFE